MKEDHLTADEEKELFRRWREDGCIMAQDRIARSVLGWANTFARNYRRRFKWRNVDESISAVNRGITRAMQLWDESNGARFITYCTFWMRSFLNRYRERDRLIRLPHHIVTSNEPEHVELKHQLSFFFPIEFRRDKTDRLWVAVATKGQVVDHIVKTDDVQRLRKRIDYAFSKIRERDAIVIECRLMYGETLAEVATRLNISRERVRQIQGKAMPKFIEWFDGRLEARKKAAEIADRKKLNEWKSANITAIKQWRADGIEDEIDRLASEAREANRKLKAAKAIRKLMGV